MTILFRSIVWGHDLGRARRMMVLSILSISLLGRAAYWAKPKLNDWLYPAPPPVQGTCSERGISLSGVVPGGDIAAAKEWARIEVPTVGQVYAWNPEKRRVELWIWDKETIWQLELICFEIKASGTSYVAQFGEFEKTSVEDMVRTDNELKAKEIGAP